MQKKRKQTLTAADEPESKINKMESSAAEAPQGTQMKTLHLSPSGNSFKRHVFGQSSEILVIV